jgi:hypothetical protein
VDQTTIKVAHINRIPAQHHCVTPRVRTKDKGRFPLFVLHLGTPPGLNHIMSLISEPRIFFLEKNFGGRKLRMLVA